MHGMGSSHRMLHGFTSGLVYKSKTRMTFFVLHSRAVLLVFVPVLSFIRWIGWSENDLTVSDSQIVVRLRLGINLHRLSSGESGEIIRKTVLIRTVVVETRRRIGLM